MIEKANCPHCDQEYILTQKGLKELDEYGKVVINCNDCSMLFVIRDDGDGPFVASPQK